jgi:hypothetical protein
VWVLVLQQWGYTLQVVMGSLWLTCLIMCYCHPAACAPEGWTQDPGDARYWCCRCAFVLQNSPDQVNTKLRWLQTQFTGHDPHVGTVAISTHTRIHECTARRR